MLDADNEDSEESENDASDYEESAWGEDETETQVDHWVWSKYSGNLLFCPRHRMVPSFNTTEYLSRIMI